MPWVPRLATLGAPVNYHGRNRATLTSTWQIVRLGGAIRPRTVWGFRLLVYGRTGGFVGLDIYFIKTTRG